MAKPSPLRAWLDGEHVADLRAKNNGARVELRYTDAALDRWSINVPVISCSLPTSDAWQDASAFLSGLLPEGRALDAMVRAANVGASNLHGLLARFGRDCAGALVIVEEHEGPEPRTDSLVPYDDASLDADVANLDDRPLAIYDDTELSLTGVQGKLLLIATDTGWARPVGGQPSTHILKRDEPRYPGLVFAEADCLRLARSVGLTSISVTTHETATAGRYIIVDRYDRRVSADGVAERLHQEDLCQAMAVDTSRQPTAKYEAHGGPRLADAARLLERYAADPEAQRRRLVAMTAFNVAIGNADAHAKNLSLLHHDDGTLSLAPMYDTVPTLRWSPPLPTRAGMFVNARRDLDSISVDDLISEATSWRMSSTDATETVWESLRQLRDALATIDDMDDATRQLIDQRLRRLERRDPSPDAP